jgi:hypothetical protein
MPEDDVLETWQEQRTSRVLSEGRTPFRVGHFEDEANGGVAWVEGEFIVDAAGADLLDLDGARGDADGLVNVPVPWLAPDLRLYRRENDGASTAFLAYVKSLRRELRSDHAVADPRIGAHYVMSGEMKGTVPRGGPASSPWVAAAVRQPPGWGTGDPVVAVVDTGIDADAAWVGSVAHDDEDIDPVYATGQPPSTFGAQGGHGTFIASLIQRMAGGDLPLRAVGVLDVDGVASELDVVKGLATLRQRPESIRLLVVNMSLGGFTDEGGWVQEAEREDAFPAPDRNRMPIGLGGELALWAQERPDTVFVAAAGNDGMLRKFWPAALADPTNEPLLVRPFFVAVGSVQRSLRASTFTNSGPWVSVSTLGEDIVSEHPTGLLPLTPTHSEVFTVRSARWSGTSFAAPLVSAEIARIARAQGVVARQAWDQLLAGLTQKITNLGQVWDPRDGTSGPARDPRLP